MATTIFRLPLLPSTTPVEGVGVRAGFGDLAAGEAWRKRERTHTAPPPPHNMHTHSTHTAHTHNTHNIHITHTHTQHAHTTHTTQVKHTRQDTHTHTHTITARASPLTGHGRGPGEGRVDRLVRLEGAVDPLKDGDQVLPHLRLAARGSGGGVWGIRVDPTVYVSSGVGTLTKAAVRRDCPP